MVARKKFKRAEAAPEIDLDKAEKFLRWLDRRAEAFSFQTWDDRGGDKRLVRLLHGSLDEHADKLVELNRRGAAVAVTMNETDLRGTKRENIVRVRALALDLDDAPLAPVWECRLEPHRVVESSPGRHHVYWEVERGDGVVLNEFEDIQRAIAKRFDGDPAVAKLTHRARLPGFFHNKGEPHLVHTVSARAHAAYDLDAICAEFPGESKPHKPSGSVVVLPAGAPLVAAEEFVERRWSIAGLRLLWSYRGSFYGWTGTHYREKYDEEVERDVYAFLERALAVKPNDDIVPYNPTRQKVQELVHALRRGLLISRDREAPMWLDPAEGDPPPSNLAICENGILNLSTREMMPHDPRLLAMNCMPLAYDPDAPEPERWYRFLEELWPEAEDEEAERCLQEIFGYLLTSDVRQHKAFIIVGPPRSGKGTIVKMLRELIGHDNVCFQTLKSMSGEFGRWPLIDKKLAVIADARLGPRADTHAVAENILSISGGDPQTINRKYQGFWTGYLGVRFLITTNELPAIADASGTLPTRFVLLRIKESFLGTEDVDLKQKLQPELAGILNWALDGLDRLRTRGKFVMPKSSRDDIRQLQELSSPIDTFVKDWCATGPGKRIDVKALYAAYQSHSEEAGQRPVPRHVFGRGLRAVLPRIRIKGRGIARTYVGVALSEDGQEQLDEIRHAKERR